MGIRVKSKENKNNDFYQTRTRNRNSETVYISRIYIHTIWKKNQGIENLINKAKKSWFILQQFLYKSQGKTVNTYLNLNDTTIMLAKAGGGPQRPK